MDQGIRGLGGGISVNRNLMAVAPIFQLLILASCLLPPHHSSLLQFSTNVLGVKVRE